jgi:hypothetical protein
LGEAQPGSAINAALQFKLLAACSGQFCWLTASGRKQLESKASEYGQLSEAIERRYFCPT